MDPALMAAAMAADNLVTALYLALISLIPDRKALVDQRHSKIVPEASPVSYKASYVGCCVVASRVTFQDFSASLCHGLTEEVWIVCLYPLPPPCTCSAVPWDTWR